MQRPNARGPARNQRNNPYALDDLMVSLHHSAAGTGTGGVVVEAV